MILNIFCHIFSTSAHPIVSLYRASKTHKRRVGRDSSNSSRTRSYRSSSAVAAWKSSLPKATRNGSSSSDCAASVSFSGCACVQTSLRLRSRRSCVRSPKKLKARSSLRIVSRLVPHRIVSHCIASPRFVSYRIVSFVRLSSPFVVGCVVFDLCVRV